MISLPTQARAPQPALESDQIRLLAEIGLTAIGAGKVKEARIIFECLRTLRPARALPYIGLALVRQFAGAPVDAVRILRDEGLRANPDNDELLVFLGFALKQAGHACESERVMRQVAAKEVTDSPEKKLAQRFLTGGGALHKYSWPGLVAASLLEPVPAH